MSVDSWRKSSAPSLVCKFDIKKAFDKVDWDFLEWVLYKKGFGSKWISWIMGYVIFPWFSILINGTLKCFFCA